MKKSILYSLVIFLSVFLGGCEKDEPMGYRGRPGVYFNEKEFSYTFAENPWKDVDTVLLPILLTRRFGRLRSKSEGGSCCRFNDCNGRYV